MDKQLIRAIFNGVCASGEGGAMSAYKWATPYEWIEQKSQDWTRERLLTEFLNLARITDSDTLQDTFQGEMDEDGYFEEGEQ